MKIAFNKFISKSTKILILLISIINIKTNILIAEESYLKDIQIESSTKSEGNNTDIPSDPLQIIEMIRRANSMNDATKPSDAIDEALKLFDKIDYDE